MQPPLAAAAAAATAAAATAAAAATVVAHHHLVILFSSGGLGDVGRHALLAALERPISEIKSIKVVTQFPEMILGNESKWNCGCEQDHYQYLFHNSENDDDNEERRNRFQVIGIKSWDDEVAVKETLQSVFMSSSTLSSSTAEATTTSATTTTTTMTVISALGNRQPFKGDYVATVGTQAVITAMQEHNVSRVVAISSVGIGKDDWPPLEWHFYGTIMKWLFRTICRDSFRDLTNAEQMYRSSSSSSSSSTSSSGIDYLLVHPVGLSEDVKPVGKWYIQKKKFHDKVGVFVAKLDVARFMVQEALYPTYHRQVVVIGSEPPPQPPSTAGDDDNGKEL